MHIDRLAGPQRPQTLLVLLPPAEAQAEDFFRQGFVADVRERALGVDLGLVDIDYQHVMAGTVVSSLRQQVLLPAQAAGYRRIWVSGISLGAFNTLYLAAACPGELAGIHLMAPYPGTRDILAEINAAGGPAAWAATPQSAQGHERVWWRWLCQAAQTSDWSTQVFLGTGSQDRFLQGQRMMASLLPVGQVSYVPGTHAWPTWRRLWQDWLDLGPLTQCAPSSRQ